MAVFEQTLMPEDVYFIPTKEAISNAKKSLNRYFEYNEGIKVRAETKPFFVSAWYDCNQFVCPTCGKTVTPDFMEKNGTDWLEFLTGAAKATDASTYVVSLPCCNSEAPLSKLDFSSKKGEKKAAIACFQINVKDVEDSINARQLAQLEKTLGCKLIAFIEAGG